MSGAALTALVTGGGGGIGRAISLALAQAGFRVVVADLRLVAAEATAEAIRTAGGDARAAALDIREEDQWRALIATVEAEGELDVLVNNAAASSPRDREVVTMEMEVWDKALAANLRGPMLGCKHALPGMLQRSRGCIVNIVSGAALTGQLSQPAYAAAKAGTISLTRSVATQYGKQGIRCNAIAPGLILHAGLAPYFPEAHVRMDADNLLTPQAGTPEDIAQAVVFLASAGACFINGHVLPVDGGLLAHTPVYAQARALGETDYVRKQKETGNG